MLAREQTFLRHRVVRGLRSRRNNDGIDVLIFEQCPVIRGGGDRLGLLRNFLQPLFLDLGNVQFADVGARGADLRAYPATPPCSDDSYVYLVNNLTIN